MVSASCESISARLALERSISARRVVSSCSRRFISSVFASAIFSAPRARSTCPCCAFDLLHARPGQHQRLALLRLLQRRLRAFAAVAVLIELRGRDVVVLVQRLRAVPIPLGALQLPIAPRPPPPCASCFSCGREPFFSSASRASVDARSALALSRCPPPGSPSAIPARSPPAPVATRADARPAASRSRCASNWSRSSRAIICPFFTASPSSTVRSISRPAVLNAMFTSVSSMLPETTMRLSGAVAVPRNAYTAAAGGRQRSRR